MKDKILIRYRHVARSIPNAFVTRVAKVVRVDIERDDLDYFEPPAEIAIFVNEHCTEMALGLAASAIWDGIKAVWSAAIKKRKTNTLGEIAVNFQLHNGQVEVVLPDNASIKGVDKNISALLDYLRHNEQLQRDLNNPDYHLDSTTKPKIRVRYNPTTDRIEVVNIRITREETERLIKHMIKNFNS
ncbi:MAG TPA: hypothetical protein VD927_04370 [Chryseosolibacter sp.]|nr:hypothetical protein [Chryseosolibacter sp.]